MSIDTTKIIHGVVGGGRYTVTSPIVKEDYGLYLKIEGLELPSTYEVDFSNSEHNGTSVTMIGNSDGVLIPSQFISSGKDVFAFLYHVGADFGRTIYKFRIPNKLRPDRTNEQPTPEEQSVIDQAINALNEAVEQTAQDVIDADASAQSASENAEQAQESARTAGLYSDTAQTYANSAEISANSASASATASANSASQAEQIKHDVESMADDAQGYATASAQSATASATSASQASASATSASQSATSAQGYASQAQTSAQIASTKASEASGYASTASTKAGEASNSASTALGYKTDAENAKIAAQTAQGKAEDAQTAAETAQGLAEDARDEAQSIVDEISGKVEQIDSNTERIESLEDDRYKSYAVDVASGAVASFSDGADDIPLKSLVVNIDPVQNLHGYDSPWVAGGGKNKLFLTATTTTINGVTFTVNDGTIVVNGTATADIVFEIWSKAQNGGNVLLPSGQYIVNGGANGGGTSTYRVGSNGFAWSGGTLKTETDSLTFTITENEAQTNIWIQVFNGTSLSNVVFKPMIRLASITDASFAPYENICPISGWTEANVPQTGKNLFDVSTLEQGGINISDGQDYTALPDRQVRNRGYIVVAQGVTYTLKVSTTATLLIAYVFFYDINKTFISSIQTSSARTYTFTVPSNCKYIRFKYYSDSSGISPSTITEIQLEIGSSATTYEPYTGRIIPISWQTEAGTVYGGSLDVLSGVMTVTHTYQTLDGDEPWSVYGERSYRFPANTRWGMPKKKLGTNNVICDAYEVVGYNSNDYIAIVGYRKIYPTSQDLKDALAQNPAHVCYELETPIEIQLDAHTINSLYGTNNIFADTGDSAVEYRADTKLYIERLTAPDSADMIADANIVSGQYFMVGNSLFKATANIANGGQITVGTNCTRVSLAQALNEINA